MIGFFHDFMNDKATFIVSMIFLFIGVLVFYIFRRMVFELNIEKEIQKQLAAIEEKKKKG